ncbi:Nramp family divalent metal transporter [Pyrobaculum neutrophilum]|uniref:Natural resistance-associated macrophage protein n=1 Tax=Pyrobaculum neutrophilum (strain DSM 2338 / JCM 9278 / NBRC 100436 / V24Sta) TaxID=444157 RepID=B1YBF3_PYRNV|nr:Nramp family divalent metal transporter [Pyrobaculum neutrophilum]ACB39284.1 natural resistance-associated macrophage protein [Pyrobaculum neutrophilum V24Sta]
MRGLLRLIGPATIVSVAYIDPGNWGANIAAGSRFGLDLLWVVWLSGAMAIYFQYLAGLLGIKEGGLLELFETRLKRFKPALAPPLVAVVLATDMAEYMGLIIALHILLGLGFAEAALLGFVDVALLALIADRRGLYSAVIGGMVAAVGLSFLAELAIVGVNWGEVLKHSVTPQLDNGAGVVAAAILGATVMPHALILHSHLAKGLPRRWHRDQTVANLAGASLINAAIQITAAAALGGREVDLAAVPNVLAPLYGPASAVLFSTALLLSSLSASAVSAEAGALAARYITGRRLEKWQTRLAARAVNALPAAAALAAGASPLDLLVYSQYALSLTLPLYLALITAWTWKHLAPAGRAAALAATAAAIALDLYSL